MKIIKKALSLALALTLLSGLPVLAAAPQMTVGVSQTVNVLDDEAPVEFQFTPSKTGYYGFYSYDSGNFDPSGYIMDADRKELSRGDDTDEGLDFFIICHMTAGKTYYLGATAYSGGASYCVMIKELLTPTAMTFEKEVYVGSVREVLYPMVQFLPQGSVEEEVTLSSSHEQVVRVIDGNLYLGIPGTTTVTAVSATGLKATCTVTVEAPPTLELNTPLTLEVSSDEQYLQFIAPEAGWYGIHSAGDEVVPMVEVLDKNLEGIASDEGTLPGEAFFAPFQLEKGQLCYFNIKGDCDTGSLQVTLQKLSAATSVSLAQTEITGYCDTGSGLNVSYEPEYAIEEKLSWSSSNEDVACVDENGHVSYLKPGNATVTVTTETGKTDTLAVTVLNSPTASDLIAWGICGPTLQWQLSSTGVLTVTGSGEMYDLYDNDSHWNALSSKITQVVFPEGITSIGYGAFLKCTQLKEIHIPNSVRTIGSSSFRECRNLEQVTLPNDLQSLGIDAFQECYALKQITLPDSLKRLPAYVFRDCSSLKQVTLSRNLISIGDQAFSGCAIEAISLPQTLKTIGYSAFAGNGLTELELPQGLTELRSYALVNCLLEELTIPATVTKLGCGVLSGNDVTTLRFLGNAPEFDQYALASLDATAYYPAGNRTWTQELLQNYGGTITWIPEGDPGVSLSGTATKGATLTLSQEGEILQTLTAENGSYRFDCLGPGSYTLTASAANRVTRAYTLNVDSDDAVQDVKLHLIGDIDGSGTVNMGDISIQYAHIKGTKKLTDEYQLLVANVNGGVLNMGDFSTLYAHIKGTKKLY